MNLSAEVRDALDNVTTAVERSAAFALLADRIGALPADVTLPPASVVVGLSCDDELIAEMRADFPQYCIRYAILAMTSACEEYLQRLLFIARLAALAAQRHGTTGKEFYETRDACRRETRQTSVDGLVPKILSAVRAETEAVDGLDWFRGIYSIRKCLVHRGGRIGPDDVAES
jgi:hypothetical protein